MITQKRLKEFLEYNPDTGVFVWTVNRKKNRGIGGVAGCVCNTSEYVIIRIDNKNYQGHRLAWLYEYGKFPSDQIDHINHNRSDNRITNIRQVTHKENSKNRSMQKNNKSGTQGVSFNKAFSKWKASIKVDSKSIHLGYFADKKDAITARKLAEKDFGFHENHGTRKDLR